LEEVLGARPLEDKDVADLAFNVHWNDVVWLPHLLELTMHQGLIQIQDQSLLSFNPRLLGPKHPSPIECLSLLHLVHGLIVLVGHDVVGLEENLLLVVLAGRRLHLDVIDA